MTLTERKLRIALAREAWSLITPEIDPVTFHGLYVQRGAWWHFVGYAETTDGRDRMLARYKGRAVRVIERAEGAPGAFDVMVRA